MDKKICLKCSTENEGNYTFCKHCGAMLPVVDRRYNYPHTEEEPEGNSQTGQPDINGVSINDMSLYVGKRAYKFVPKFIRMQVSGESASFCAPVFLFGLFFGFFGTSIWFFWRKMPKIGSILLLIGLLLSAADTFLNYSAYSAYMDGLLGLFYDILHNPLKYSDMSAVNGATEAVILEFTEAYNPIFSLINRYVGNLAVPSVMSIFALSLYKDKAVSDIKAIRQSEVSPAENLISQKGGCSGLLVLIPIFAEVLTSVLLTVTWML